MRPKRKDPPLWLVILSFCIVIGAVIGFMHLITPNCDGSDFSNAVIEDFKVVPLRGVSYYYIVTTTGQEIAILQSDYEQLLSAKGCKVTIAKCQAPLAYQAWVVSEPLCSSSP